MEKKGTIKFYRMNSLSYKIQRFSDNQQKFHTTLTRICASPLFIYIYVKSGEKYGIGWTIAGCVLQACSYLVDIPSLIRTVKEGKAIKAEIAQHLSEIEPDVISDEEDQKQFVKRI